ncbi:DUF1629 domain-containing protein [Bradyrhizobium sp. C9]|uniref:imm11 family protein n=1 Tax=Bradyrhizobium sp. C9 TaxID=142585 RepID=UPI0011780231|nr:DUF1629 domain-containing protein [Bradyrhizobium sp. C9]
MPKLHSSERTRNRAVMAAAASVAKLPSSRAGRPGERLAKRRKFYLVTEKPGTRGGGYELLNKAALFQGHPKALLPPLGQRGFREYPEAPLFLADARLGAIDKDFAEYSGYWFISGRMKAALELIDAEAFAFLECRVQLRSGADAPGRWLCDVVRVVDALDEEESAATIGVSDNGSKVYHIPMSANLLFKESAVGPHHIFRMKYFEAKVVCDEEMRLACKTAEFTGISFADTCTRQK